MMTQVTLEETDGLGKALDCHDAKLDTSDTFSSKLWNQFSLSSVLTVLFYILVSQILFLYKKFSEFAFFY